MKTLIVFLIALFIGIPQVRPECVTINTEGWTNRQKGMVVGACVYLAYQADLQDHQGWTITDGNIVCLPDASGFDMPTVLSTKNVLAQANIFIAEQDIAEAEQEAKREAAVTELTNNELQTWTPLQINNWINNQIDSATNIAEMKAVIKTIIKKMALYHAAWRDLR